MHITAEIKENNKLVLNGVNLGTYTDEQLRELVSELDFIAHHKHNLYEKYKDHYAIEIRDIDFGVWEVSQIRNFIEQIDR
jgi:hypothetical protein